jgi:GH24 family phage-related lysozyme (muramidase)
MNIYYGVVEDRINDPLKLGRVRVRISGIHTENKQELPTADLPWALVMQPTSSAANSGVGFSPTGILEGTWVMLVYRDEDQQSPIVIGTLPGIPSIDKVVSNPGTTSAVVSSDGTAWKDSSGAPIKSGSTGVEKELVAEPEDDASTLVVKKPSAMTTSEEGFKFLKSLEGLASLVKGRVRIGNDSTPDSTLLYPYPDNGNLAIGWGNQFMPDGSRVNSETVISKADADELKLKSLREDQPGQPAFEKSARRLIKVPVTQSMFDACVSMIYNMGAGGFSKTEVLTALNAGKYAAAAALIPTTKNNNGTLTSRRNKEKNLFLKDGIPNADGSVEKVLGDRAAVLETPPDATKNPVVLAPVGAPGVTTSVGANPTQLSEPGFSDPNKIYPKFLDEPDTHRLARHEKLDGTIVVLKEAARVTGVPCANGSNWNQPRIPYNAQYPYNTVYSSPSGHVQEYDDTPGNERVHSYHKAGTYTEIDVNGTEVHRIVGDSFTIIERNGHILIRGSCNITVEGDANIRVENNTTLETLGNLDVKVGGDVGIGAGGNIRLASGGDISLDGANVHFNSGMGGGVKKASGSAQGQASFAPLSTPNRNDFVDYSYETPEEGDNTEFRAIQIARGNINPDEVKTEKVEEETKVPENKVPVPIASANCDAIMSETKFTYAYKLTDNFTLGDILTGNGRSIPSGNNVGLSAQQIVCNLKQLVIHVLDPVKRAYPNMVITNSWRSEAYNTKIGGSKTSDHMTGCAADLVFTGFNSKQTFDACVAIQKMLPAYNQILLEYTNNSMWIHIAYKSTGNKMQTMTIKNHSTYNRSSFVLLR